MTALFFNFLFVTNLFHFSLQTIIQISWEATPGLDTGVLPNLSKASYQIQKEYFEAISEALELKNNNDIISNKINLNISNHFEGYSAWKSNIGVGEQTFVDIDILNPKSTELVSVFACLLGFLLRQDSVIWYYKQEINKINGISVDFYEKLSLEEFKEIYNIIYDEFGTWNLAPGYTSTGFNTVNYEANLLEESFKAGMRNVLSRIKSINIGNGVQGEHFFYSNGDYLSNDWKVHPDGEQYIDCIKDEELIKWVKDLQKSRIDIVNEEFATKNYLKRKFLD